MKTLLAAAALLALAPALAVAQFPERVQSGARVRVWLHEDQKQEQGPWHRQLLRATVSDVSDQSLRISVPGTEGILSVPRTNIRQLDVSLGTSRAASALERAVGLAIGGAITLAFDNDPTSERWPHYNRTWRAAGEGAKWGALLGAAWGLVFPTERWSRARLR